LYSAISTLKSGPYYLLGYNPGGDPSKISTSLKDQIQKCETEETNAFLDEFWAGSEQHPRYSRYQLNVQALCDAIDIKTRKMCASNLVFVRSIRVADVGKKMEDCWPIHSERAADVRKKMEDCFWPIHEAVLDIVMPSCIFAIGQGTYRTVMQRLGFGERNTFESGHGSWRCRVSAGTYRNKPMKLIGFPHFSWYTLKGRGNVLSQVSHVTSVRL